MIIGNDNMYLGRVMGSATSTVKHPSMEGTKLLLVMALQADGKTIEGDPILVVDKLGAGLGQMVMITSDGIGAREMLGSENSPVRWTTLGIPDQ
jgi:microcompartment protein CcmK/EutM